MKFFFSLNREKMEIEIENFKGIGGKFVFVEGTNILKGERGAGKTSILNALQWCLFSSNKNIAPLFNKKAKTKVVVKFKDIKITRTKPPDIVIFKNKDGEWKGDEAQSIIEKEFGNKETWQTFNFIHQKEMCILMFGTKQEKLDIIKTLIFNSNSDILEEKINERIKSLEQTHNSLNIKIMSLEDMYLKDKEKTSDLKDEWNEIKDIEEIENINERIEILEELINDMNLYIEYKQKKVLIKEKNKLTFQEEKDYYPYLEKEKFLNSTSLNKSISLEENYSKQLYSLENELNKIKKDKEKCEKWKVDYNNIKEINIEYEKNKYEIEKNTGIVCNDNKRIKEENEKLKEYCSLLREKDISKLKDRAKEACGESMKCPECKTSLILIENTLKVLDFSIDKAKKRKIEECVDFCISTKYPPLQKYLDLKEITWKDQEEIEKNIKILKEKERDQVNMKKYLSFPQDSIDIEEINKLKEINKKLSSFSDLNPEGEYEEDEIEKKKNKLKRFKDTREQLKRKKVLSILFNSLNEKKQKIKEYVSEKEKIEKRLEDCKILKNIIIETVNETISEKIDSINSLLNEILSKLFDDIKVEINMFKYIKTSKIPKPEFNIKVIKDGNEYDNLQDLSGGEKDTLSIALTITLNLISGSNIIIFDESMSSLGLKHREQCFEVIKEYCSSKICIEICHDTIEGYYDNVISL